MPYTTEAEAKKALQAKIEATEVEQIERIEEVGAYTVAERKEAQAKLHAAVTGDPLKAEEITEREWTLIAIANAWDEIARYEDTISRDLICPAGRFLLIDPNEDLISPAGFHPSDRVYIKPKVGAIVDILPRHSNLNYHDFTKEEQAA